MFAVVTVTRAADAAPSRVILVVPPDASPLAREATTRVRAELTAAGFDAVETAPTDADARAQVERGDGEGTVATIALSPAPGGTSIDVWVHDTVTGKSLVRRIAVGSGRDAARVVAIRAIELLRASLLEATTPAPRAPEAPAPPPPPPDVSRWMSAPPVTSAPLGPLVPSFAISAGATALFGFDGLPVAPMPELRLAAGLGDRAHARLALAGPGFVSDVSGAAGSAVVRQELARLELVYAPPLAGDRVVPTFALGAGGYHLHARGDAAPTFRSSSDDAWALLASAGVGVAARLSAHAALVLDGSAVFLFPRPVVVLGDARVASAGRPSALASFGVLASF